MMRDVTWEHAAHDHRVLDLRPVVWDASMVTPSEDDGVTIVLRVTYRTIEDIILDTHAVTETGTRRPN